MYRFIVMWQPHGYVADTDKYDICVTTKLYTMKKWGAVVAR